MPKSIGQIHWDYFLLLEEDLIELFRFVEPVPSNFNTYSSKIAKLYLATCSEVDVALKDLIKLHEDTAAETISKNNIAACRKFVQDHYSGEFGRAQVTFIRTELILSPWDSWWDREQPTSTNPGWWDSYNKVKHHRAEHYNEANFENLINAIAALFVVNNCIFKKECIDGLPRELRTTRITEFAESTQALGANEATEAEKNMTAAIEEHMDIEKNPFDHILYEMSMYIKTYRFKTGNQILTNLLRANHSVHLRNLTYFFKPGATGNNDWHYSEFINDETAVNPLPKNISDECKKYCCGAVDHLNGNRMNDDYKKKTGASEDAAFPEIIRTIQEFLAALDADVNQDNVGFWKAPNIQKRAKELRELCELHDAGGGVVLVGECQLKPIPMRNGVLPRFF